MIVHLKTYQVLIEYNKFNARIRTSEIIPITEVTDLIQLCTKTIVEIQQCHPAGSNINLIYKIREDFLFYFSCLRQEGKKIV